MNAVSFAVKSEAQKEQNNDETKLLIFPENEKARQKAREESFVVCAEIAKSNDILESFSHSIEQLGVVGETKICKFLYLSIFTRLFDHPVSIAVKGPSAGGKSFLVERVLDFFPSSAYYMLSSMSPKAIIYTEESFKNRFLYFAEADGICEQMEYYIRTLLSENCLRHEVTEKGDNGEFHTRLIEKEGPTGIILTTTKTSLHPENETRITSVNVVDTKKQTEEVLKRIAEEDNDSLDLENWLAFHDWVSLGSTEVKIPYAGKLASLIRADALRIKRDFKSLLNLIKAHALIHQLNREKTEKGYVVATLEDYAAVKDIVGLFISEAVESSVSNTIRETVNVVASLLNSCKQNYTVSIAEISQKLQLEKSVVARRIRIASEAGYLKNLEARPGRPAKVKLGNPLPEEQEVLPSVDKLKE